VVSSLPPLNLAKPNGAAAIWSGKESISCLKMPQPMPAVEALRRIVVNGVIGAELCRKTS